MFNLVLELCKACEGDRRTLASKIDVNQEALSKFIDYAATSMENLGNYKGYGDQKFIPRISQQKLEKLCTTTQDALELLGCVQSFLFTDGPKALGYPAEGGMSNYSPESLDLSREEIRAVQDVIGSRVSPRNTRLQKRHTDSGVTYHLFIASAVEHAAKTDLKDLVLPDRSKLIVKYGDHSDAPSRMCASLAKAKDFAASERQENYLSKLISSYQTGDIDTPKEASRDWLADETPCVETWSGFLEPSHDLSGTRCEFEDLVAVQDKKLSAAFDQLSSRAEKFILQLPWSGLGPDRAEPGPLENESIIKPNFVALDRE